MTRQVLIINITRMGDLVYRSLRGGREAFVLRARSLSGREQEQLRLETVTAEFGYVADGQPGRGSTFWFRIPAAS